MVGVWFLRRTRKKMPRPIRPRAAAGFVSFWYQIALSGSNVPTPPTTPPTMGPTGVDDPEEVTGPGAAVELVAGFDWVSSASPVEDASDEDEALVRDRLERLLELEERVVGELALNELK